ncbi:MAG: GFA family protein [Spirochaetaceae bacterium]
MIKASCLCNKVKVEINGDFVIMTNCHCSKCRKFTGSAFGTLALCKKEDFKIVSGKEFISNYEMSDDFTRTFCKCCGSPLPVEGHVAFQGLVAIPAGILDDDPKIKPSKHLFVGSKAPGWDIHDDIENNEEWYPGYKKG